MKTRLRSAVVFAICLFIGLSPANAWNPIGHMAVAYAAWQQMTPATRQRALVLLKKNPNYKTWKAIIPAGTTPDDQDLYIFMMAATWPDQIKASNSGYKKDADTPPQTDEATRNTGYRDKYMHRYWHFIDIPFSTDGSSLSAASTPTPNAETQIGIFRQVLASNASDPLKSYDLVWIMHLVGDVHQPLHGSTRVTSAPGQQHGDAGGNSVKLTNSPGDLHGYWDNILGTGETKDFKKAAKAAQLLPAAGADASDANEADWVKESFDRAKSSVYVVPVGAALGPYTLDEAYSSNSLAIAQQRVALAGARLANLLNENLK
ncbi:S1/P1 nuclease [Alloacidobacterium sp.]|uniref:S1/P1 nuclease n=1 Tax=Alloacidobacterium sp. TaxID=2951999 RepID=UPI002D4E3BDE|nr:S1/P1 nuclease [Alloacidobacterium sp.]HYK34797.1 S1/P1 nuclease [Alloacidobacterium sp.]